MQTRLREAERIVMKQLASTVSKKRGVPYAFGPEYEEYTAKN